MNNTHTTARSPLATSPVVVATLIALGMFTDAASITEVSELLLLLLVTVVSWAVYAAVYRVALWMNAVHLTWSQSLALLVLAEVPRIAVLLPLALGAQAGVCGLQGQGNIVGLAELLVAVLVFQRTIRLTRELGLTTWQAIKVYLASTVLWVAFLFFAAVATSMLLVLGVNLVQLVGA